MRLSVICTLAPAIALCLSACMAGPNYKGGDAAAPDGWPSLSGHFVSGDSNETWWTLFRDPYLDRLERKALENNNQLASAQARVDAADANVTSFRGELFPRVDATASVSRGRSGPDKADLATGSRVGLSGAFEIDPAGGNRRRLEAALAEADAARADRDRIRADLIADTAVNYIRLLGAKREYALTQVNLRAQGDNLEITEGLRREGSVSDLELNRARAQSESTRSRLPSLETQITSFANQLGVLTGMQPGQINKMLNFQRAIPRVSEKIVVATPIATIANRPSIRVAERRLARDTALVGAASAQLFPSLSLGAFFGLGQTQGSGSFTPWNAAASTLMPLLNFGRIKGQIDVADAHQREAYHNYHEAVLQGLADVDSAMAAYTNEQARMHSLSDAAVHEGSAVHIAQEQYKAGTTGQIDLLIAEENRLDADVALAQSQTLAAENLVELYRAMGWGALVDAHDAPVDVDMDVSDEGATANIPIPAHKFFNGKMRPIVDQ